MLNNACLVCGSKRHFAGYHERSATSVQRPAPKQAARTAAVTSDEDLYTKWYGDGNKLGVNLAEHLLDEAWLPMTMVLAALGEKSTNNARRYLCETPTVHASAGRLGARTTSVWRDATGKWQLQRKRWWRQERWPLRG